MNSITPPTEAMVAATLVAKILSGDKAAENDMVLRYQRGIKAVLFQRSKDRYVLDDVIQETWIVVLQKVRKGELRDPSKLSAFIIQIAKNQLIMKFRKEGKHQDALLESNSQPESKELSPEQASENSQLAESMNIVFSEMNQQRDKDILQRFFLTGDSKAELCIEYGLTANHFDRVLYRARNRFKALWAQKYDSSLLNN